MHCFRLGIYGKAFALCLVCMGLILAPALADDKLPFSDQELSRLVSGEVVIRHLEEDLGGGESTSLLVAAIWVPHPEEVIWEVLNHPERETEWIPQVNKSELVKDECLSPARRVNVTDYVVGGYGLSVYYSLIREYDYENRIIKARLDKSRPARFFREVEAGWDLYPYQNGTIFQYWSDSRLVVDIPRFISEALAERTLTAGVSAVAKRCNQIAQEMKTKGATANPCAQKNGDPASKR